MAFLDDLNVVLNILTVHTDTSYRNSNMYRILSMGVLQGRIPRLFGHVAPPWILRPTTDKHCNTPICIAWYILLFR